MVTRFVLTIDDEQYVFTAKKPWVNGKRSKVYEYQCNGITVDSSYYNKALKRFKESSE